jgi:hypothetical protein
LKLVDRHPRYTSAFVLLAMLSLTGVFYLRPDILSGSRALVGLDYDQLHIRRIAFARASLAGVRHTIPGWYPHEVLGSPFAANLQSFPWLPTRLLLLSLDPSIAFAAGVAMAAMLAALFTFLYCRRAGISRVGAATAGGTFACAGYFASRVMAGHLPLLEAYPALPLLLWLVDRCLAPERWRRRRFDLAALALCTTCVVVAGHPQLPAYSVAAALLCAAWRGRTWLQARVACALVLGVGLALAVWWPMLLLIGRSTRVQHLAPTDNDIAMPYARLMALIAPGIHGWADPVALADGHPFVGFPNPAYFWDTAVYIGILPLLSIAALLIGCVVRKKLPDVQWRFLACLGVVAFACSLPLATPLIHLVPGTFFRSPARLLYVPTFCAAVALGVAVDRLGRAQLPLQTSVRTGLLAAVLALHFADLWGFDHWFIQTAPRTPETPQFESILDREVGDGRIAEERDALLFSYADRYDDAGGFDSIFLARFNRGIVALAGSPPDLNQQEIDASELPLKALEALGVRFVITTQTRTDLQLVSTTDEANLYRVANPAPRARFFAGGQTVFAEERRIPKLFATDPRGDLLLPAEASFYSSRYEVDAGDEFEIGNGVTAAGSDSLTVAARTRASGRREQGFESGLMAQYARPWSDEIRISTNGTQNGFAEVLEAYDPGWTAAVDGAPSPLVPANGFAMAVPVTAGSHEVRLRYHTVGRVTGITLSILSAGLLVLLIGLAKFPNSE